MVEINESEGLLDTIEQLVLDALDAHLEIGAMYSIGGGNVATLRAFEQKGRRCRVFIAHDLDEDNSALLAPARCPRCCTTICVPMRTWLEVSPFRPGVDCPG